MAIRSAKASKMAGNVDDRLSEVLEETFEEFKFNI